MLEQNISILPWTKQNKQKIAMTARLFAKVYQTQSIEDIKAQWDAQYRNLPILNKPKLMVVLIFSNHGHKVSDSQKLLVPVNVAPYLC